MSNKGGELLGCMLSVLNVYNLENQAKKRKVRICTYLSTAIPKWFPKLGSVETMRAHWVGAAKEDANGRPFPHTVLLKLLRFTDRDRILGAARKTKVEVDGVTIRFAPDYSTQTFRRRLAFSAFMYALQ